VQLGDQLRVMQRDEPGREVDLIAHSQGGVVVDVFLARHYRAHDPTLPPLGTVVTVSSPHQGAPLATAGDVIRRSPVGEVVLDGVGSVASSMPPPNGTSVRELSERSELMREVRRRGVPEHFDVTSVGAAEDVVVPASHISLDGAQETVVAVNSSSQHSAVLGDPDALRAMRAALEGRAPPCVGLDTALRSAVAPVVISRITHEVGGLASTVLGGRG
jgi:triacylglycerol esterase/lipase EstA (alpha/beta hydrolase family)